MSALPSRAVMLFGTDEPVAPSRTLRAGPLAVELDCGNLRTLRLGGVEALRAVSYIVRDRNWGTCNPEIRDLRIEETDDGFTVAYEAVCRVAAQELRYAATIVGRRDGTLRFAAEASAVTDFVTNRAGFVVLHPIASVAGGPVEVLHVDGHTELSVFPDLIEPAQPFKDIRALTHEVTPGVRVTCTMEGDACETEDQRNWSDASYKTYVRPLARPWPYTLRAGETTRQAVAMSVDGPLSAGFHEGSGTVTVSVGEASGTMPRIGLGVAPEHAASALDAAEWIAAARPQLLVCHFDPGAGHGVAELRQFQALGAATGAELVLEAVVPVEGDAPAAVLARIARQAAEAGATFAAVAVSPAPDLKSTQPDGKWPACPPLEEVYAAARAAFPSAAIGGGMFSYFTELNRKRPAVEALDFVTHTTCPIVHSGDDLSVMETLESLPAIIRSTRAFIGDKPYCVGPSAIGMRANPYGAAPVDNRGNGRVAMARLDPRQRGLLGAAWNLGYAAHMARGGIAAVTLSAPVGEFGIVTRPMPHPQPWFDEAGGVFPVFHVVAGLAAGAGAPRLETASSASRDVESVAWRQDGRRVLWLANLTGEERVVEVVGLPLDGALVKALDETNFVAATRGPDAWRDSARAAAGGRVSLLPYAVARFEVAG